MEIPYSHFQLKNNKNRYAVLAFQYLHFKMLVRTQMRQKVFKYEIYELWQSMIQ
jgi:hypothetical protein